MPWSTWLLLPGLLLPQTDRIDQLLARKELSGARVAVSVVDLDSGEAVYARAIDEPLAPASNMKLITTAAAVTLLGPEYSFETRLLAESRPDDDGRLPGDLLVVGGADPCLRAELMSGQGVEDPAALLADMLAAAGVRSIGGGLLLDDGLLDQRWVHEDWGPEDLMAAYAAPIGALSIHGNCLQVAVDGGSRPTARILTLAGGYRVRADLRVADKSNTFSVGQQRPDAEGVVRISGRVGRAVGRRPLQVPVVDPTEFFGRCLYEQLALRGIDVEEGVHRATGVAQSRPGAVVIGLLETPLDNALVLANKESDNSIADHLFKLLGARVGGEGSFEGGERAVKAFLDKHVRTSVEEVVLRDGSGISPRNRLTARVVADTLVVLGRAEPAVRDRFLRTLPVSGLDGSLSERMSELPYRGAVRAKTGYIGGVSTLSGYARTRSGRTLAFSILINGFKSQYSNRQMKAIQDDICRALVDL
jgi:D-alanyl-D-alanine carboxypeptidase/D-alanyl-D-alanine-endopeptidase (penicillin-binding protein 4)